MGKKTKKTKWRTLEISLPVAGKNYHENGTNLQLDDGWRTSYDKYRRSSGYDKIIKSSAAFSCDAKNSSPQEETHAKTQIEDEYTKITTPRQDVLFKKGYLTRRKTLRHTCDENTTDNFISNETVNFGVAQADCASNGDEEFCDYATISTDGGSRLPSLSPVQPQSQLLCATSPPYIDASSAAAAIYYGGGYEIYDPYTGSVTALVSSAAAAATCQPILTSMPCGPVPLQPLQWFNPVPSSNEWCCDANSSSSYAAIVDDTDAGDGDSTATATATAIATVRASHSGDSSNAGTSASESSSAAENTTPTTGGDVPLYSHPSQSYIYPSYVFGTAVYSVEDDCTNIQYCSAESPILSSNESAITKRKKRRKRRRRFGETEDDSESGVEENHEEYVFTRENVVDCAYDEYKDNDEAAAIVQNQTNTPFGSQNALQSSRDCTSLSHSSINAPPFIPANRSGGVAAQTSPYAVPQRFADDSSCCGPNNAPAEKYADKVVPKSSSLTNVVDSNMLRESFVNGQSKSLTDSPSSSSSSNSDSGISSPGSEECPSVGQHQDFRKSVQADRSKTSFSNATSVTSVGDAVGSAAIIPIAAAVSDCDPKNCDSSCSSTDAKCGRGDCKSLKKVRAKNANNRVKRCHSKNEERNLNHRRCTPTENLANDENVDCAQGVVVFVAEPSAPENHPKKSTNIESTKQIERIAAGAAAADDDENSATCSDSRDKAAIDDDRQLNASTENEAASGANSSLNEKNGRDERENCDYADDARNGAGEKPPSRSCVTWPEQKDRLHAVIVRENHRLGDNVNRIASADEIYACAADNTADSWSLQLDQSAALSAETTRMYVNGPSSQSHVEESTPRENVSERATQDCGFSRDVADCASPQSKISRLALGERQRKYSDNDDASEHVAVAARIIIDEIVQRAESQIHARLSTTKCDKLQLPLTQAVTNWLNERGGLPAVDHGFANDHRLLSTQPSYESLDSKTMRVCCENQSPFNSSKSVEKSKTSSSNCVIC